MDDPASTVALLKANAVVGVTAFLAPDGSASSIGYAVRRCAIQPSTIRSRRASAAGVTAGRIATSTSAPLSRSRPTCRRSRSSSAWTRDGVRKVLRSWGPGKDDAELVQDGKAMRPDGKSAATLLPAAFGLAGVNLHTYTGWGSVLALECLRRKHADARQGRVLRSSTRRHERFPVAAKAGFSNVRNDPGPHHGEARRRCTSISSRYLRRSRPAGSFDPEAAKRGEAVFAAQGRCAQCHVPPLFTEPGWAMHTAKEIGIDDFQAERSPDRRYRTTPLAGLFTRMKGGFYHDGRFPTLEAVVNHYDGHFNLKLTTQQKQELIEYLKSL